MDKQRYQVTQDDQDYILSTYILNEKIVIECQDRNFSSSPTYRRDYSLQELKSFTKIFSFINTLNEALNELNNSIERQQVKITNKGEIMDILFNIQYNNCSQELSFQLDLIQQSSQNYIKAGPIIQMSNNNINTNTNTNAQVVVNNPVIMGVPGYNTQEDDYPDCTYSTKPNQQEVYQAPVHEEIGCGCVADHDRINKIEANTQLLKGEHESLKQRLNDLKAKIQMINKQTSEIRGENGILNAKTLQLKKQYNNLIEAEAALRAENDELRREKHELILKKNELGFYINDQHNHDTVKEVNIPLEGKRRRPTNVSKREKQFGAGYSSHRTNNAYKGPTVPQTGNINYSSAYLNNNDFEEDFK